MKKSLPAVVAALLLGAGVYGQQLVDQGQPGNQGPWPVSITGAIIVNFDAGFIGSIAPVKCAATIQDGGTANQNTVIGAAAGQVPGAPSAGRAYVNICNSAQNASTAIIKCRQDGTAPVFAAGNPGDVLLFGDCLLSTAPTTANTIQCIGSGAGLNVTTYECVPQ